MYCVLPFFLPYFLVAEVHSPLVTEKENHKKEGEVDMLENEEELPKENGGQLTNGIGADYRSDRSEERQPDVMDDHPGKSRSISSFVTPVISYVNHIFQIWYFI